MKAGGRKARTDADLGALRGETHRARWDGGEGGIRTRGGFYPSHAFQACDLNRSSTSPVARIVPARIARRGAIGALSGTRKKADDYGFCACTIFIAEAISADTSVMLLGTISVVVASVATRL